MHSEPFSAHNIASLFRLKEGLTFLNFGSFGACPVPVMQHYQALQWEMEEDPVAFITQKGLHYLHDARKALGAYVGSQEDDLVMVTNPSYAVNTIAKGLQLKAGDEILTTSLEYGACDKAWMYYCEQEGAKYIRQPISLPLVDKELFIAELFKGVSKRTRLLFISHITSSTALRLPVEEVCKKAKALGIITFVDGAHAPAHIPLDLWALQADIYTGACHKWMLAPKGSSFLYVTKSLQAQFDPLVISWGYKALFPSHSQFLDYHQMNGTRDYTAMLTVPKAIGFMQEHHWWQVAAHCRQLVSGNAAAFYQALGAKPLSLLGDEYSLQMLSAEVKTTNPEQLHDVLLQTFQIQIPVMRHGDKVYLRFSINAFNEQKDLDKLYDALKKIKSTTNILS